MTIEDKYAIAIQMLADWVAAVDINGTGWDDWDEFYKDAAYREGPLREDLDKEIKRSKESMTWDNYN